MELIRNGEVVEVVEVEVFIHPLICLLPLMSQDYQNKLYLVSIIICLNVSIVCHKNQ